MAGLSRSFEGGESAQVSLWIDAAATSGMPFDPGIWLKNPPRGTYSACLAVKAAGEQGSEAEGRYLRLLREGIMCRRRRLDHVEALREVAAEAGLDVGRFGIDLESTATLEAFGADLEAARELAGSPVKLPVARFGSPLEGAGRAELASVERPGEYGSWRTAAIEAGAEPVQTGRPTVAEAFDRFGRLAAAELLELTGLAEPVLMAELWAGAREWRYRPERILTGTLWEPAG